MTWISLISPSPKYLPLSFISTLIIIIISRKWYTGQLWWAALLKDCVSQHCCCNHIGKSCCQGTIWIDFWPCGSLCCLDTLPSATYSTIQCPKTCLVYHHPYSRYITISVLHVWNLINYQKPFFLSLLWLTICAQYVQSTEEYTVYKFYYYFIFFWSATAMLRLGHIFSQLYLHLMQ